MAIQEMYAQRLDEIISAILADMEGLPEGPELEQLRELMEQMQEIADRTLGERTE